MKNKYIIAMMVTGIFLVSGAGTAFSNWNENSGSDMSSGESMSAPSAPDAGTWTTEGPSETGSLNKEGSLSSSRSDVENIPVHESGGVLFREGIDDGP